MHDTYDSPLCTRYASREMQRIFSDDEKFGTWRRLWVALAESEKELGLAITDEQIAALRANVDNIDYDLAREYESRLRHDVMAHIHTYGDCCPVAKGIIHLGATSCYVGDNTDIIVMKKALLQIRKLLLNTISAVRDFALEHKGTPTLAYTHFQAAQPTTVGKRASLWLQDLVYDLNQLDFQLDNLVLLGCKGTTGTAASFMELFDNDDEKVKALDRLIAEKTGFKGVAAVSGQTYSRKLDFYVISVLSSVAQSAAKFSNDTRLLSHLREFDEPFEKSQVGSSAMAYKRNPMRSERIASLARYIICDAQNPALTAAAQWFERTLDDSANRRLAIPEAFLACDAILNLYINIIKGGTVYPAVALAHLREEIPFMATENILMLAVSKGGDRQELHEAIREHSVEVTKRIKLYGDKNDLLERIENDSRFNLSKDELRSVVEDSRFTGRAEKQTEEFIADVVDKILADNSSLLGMEAEVNV